MPPRSLLLSIPLLLLLLRHGAATPPPPSLLPSASSFPSFPVSILLIGSHNVEQAGLKLTEICLPLPPKCWDKRHAPLCLA